MKKTWLAGLLSFIFPGIGQFYIGKIAIGFIFLVGYILTIVMTASGQNMIILLGGLLTFIVWIVNIIHAIISTKKINNSTI